MTETQDKMCHIILHSTLSSILRPESFWNSNRGLNWSSNQFEKLPKKILIKFKEILFFCLQDMIENRELFKLPCALTGVWHSGNQLIRFSRNTMYVGSNASSFGQPVFFFICRSVNISQDVLVEIGKPWNWNEILSGFCRLITGTISLSGLARCRRSSELRKIGLGSIQSSNWLQLSQERLLNKFNWADKKNGLRNKTFKEWWHQKRKKISKSNFFHLLF